MNRIKFKIFSLFFLLSILIDKKLIAQTADEGASLGMKAGVNFTNYNLQDASAKTLPGFNIGLFSRAAFSKYIAIQPEFNFNMQHSKITVNPASDNTQFSLWMSYIEFALSGVATYHKGFFQFGPYISYLANMNVKNESANNQDISDIINRKNFYDIDFGFTYTLGIQLKRWDLGIRYNQGLFITGKEKTPNGELNIYRQNKTSMPVIFAGYYF